METVKVSVSNCHPRLVLPRRTQGGANTTANPTQPCSTGQATLCDHTSILDICNPQPRIPVPAPPLSLPNGLMNATTLERESPSVCPSVLLAYTVGFTFSFLSTSLTQHSLPVKPCDRFTAAQSSPPAPGETASTHGSTRASGPGSTAAGSESVRVVVFVSCPTTTTTAPPISRGWRWLAGWLPAGQSLNQSVRSVE